MWIRPLHWANNDAVSRLLLGVVLHTLGYKWEKKILKDENKYRCNIEIYKNIKMW